ncbi:MAG: hypothetical protein JW958_12515 [Candidatus Eisenbacteria bacterium]|nr:hypothetical protein [Candidatus Eisenbacteria bacterium]
MDNSFLVGQILEITIGEKVDNKLYRAQVTQADRRNVVLHVPGFDPLRFVDLLKGTAVSLRTHWRGKPHVGAARLAQHFKDSSPYVVIQRPERLDPVERCASARIEADFEVEYTAPEQRLIREADRTVRLEEGRIRLYGVPEPFDVGTMLHLSARRDGGRPIRFEGRVVHVSKDPDDPSRYEMAVAVGTLGADQKEALLDAVLRREEEEPPADPGLLERDCDDR